MPRDWSRGVLSGYCVEIGEHLSGNLQGRGLEILAKMMERRCPGDHKDVRRAVEQPRQGNLHRRGIEARRRFRQDPRLQWTEPAKGKERNVRDAVTSKVRDQRIVGPMRQVAMILDADDGDDPPRLRDLRRRDVAQPGSITQAYLLPFGQGGGWRLDRPG